MVYNFFYRLVFCFIFSLLLFLFYILLFYMIFVSSLFRTSDNSGAKKVLCIKVLKGNSCKATFCDSILGVVKKARIRKKVKVGDIRRCLVIRCKSRLQRSNGVSLFFKKIGVIIIDKNLNPVGSRIFGPAIKEFRETNYLKVLSMSSCVL